MSLAAGLLTAALALPPQGLVAAYDFARVNFVNYSEEFTQAGWNKAGCTVDQGSLLGTTYEGQPITLIRYLATNASQAGNGLTGGGGGTGGLSVIAGQMVYASVFVAPIDAPSAGIVISTGVTQLFTTFNFNTRTFADVSGASASARYELLPNGVYRLIVGWVATGTMTVRTHVGYVLGLTSVYIGGACIATGQRYEKTTDSQTLLDRSVRLWPASATRTNLVRWSDDPLASTWASGGSTPTITPNTGTTPRGHPAWTIAGGWRAAGVQNYAGVKLTSACVMKGSAGSATTFFVFPRGTGQSITVDVNGTVTANSLVDGTHAVTPLGGGWFEVALTYTPDADRNISSFYVQAGNAVQIGEARVNIGAVALPYERQTDGVTYDLSQRGMRNLIPNSELARTSDSQLPTGWSLQLPSGLSASSSYGLSAAGVPYLQVTLTGAVSSGGQAFNLYMAPTGAGGVPITPGATYSVAVDAVQVSGPAMALQVGTHQWSTSGTYTGTSGASGATTGAGDEPRRLGGAVTMLAATQFATPRLGATVAWPVESSQTRVYRISQPQLELGSVPTTYQRSPSHGTLGSSTGPDSNDPAWTPQGIQFDGVDDRITASGLSLSANNTALVVFSAPTPSIDFTSYLQVETAQNGRARISTMLNNRLVMECLGSTYKSVSTPNNGFTPNVPIFAAVSFTSEGVVNGYVNGRLIGSTTGGVSVSKTRASLQFGMRDGGGAFASGVIHYAALWDRALTDAEITQAYRFIRNQLSRRGVTI